jgi:hypothetical protein
MILTAGISTIKIIYSFKPGDKIGDDFIVYYKIILYIWVLLNLKQINCKFIYRRKLN